MLRGNPLTNIADVHNVELLFKNGVAYDPDALISSVEGTVGEFEFKSVLHSPLRLTLLGMAFLLAIRIAWRTVSRLKRRQVATS